MSGNGEYWPWMSLMTTHAYTVPAFSVILFVIIIILPKYVSIIMNYGCDLRTSADYVEDGKLEKYSNIYSTVEASTILSTKRKIYFIVSLFLFELHVNIYMYLY